MSEYTSGPWSVSTRNSWRVADAHDNTIASTGTDSAISHHAHMANARLIAAAPDMLEALKIALHDYETSDGLFPLDEVRAAIAKATNA